MHLEERSDSTDRLQLWTKSTNLNVGSVLVWRLDAFHAAVQPPGKAAATEMVHGHSGARQEEDGEGAYADRARPQTKDVQLP